MTDLPEEARRDEVVAKLRWLADKTGAGLLVSTEKPLLREVADLLECDQAVRKQRDEELRERLLSPRFARDLAGHIHGGDSQQARNNFWAQPPRLQQPAIENIQTVLRAALDSIFGEADDA